MACEKADSSVVSGFYWRSDFVTKEMSSIEETRHCSYVWESLMSPLQILRKKYYNMVEDMKGKIRVYCRARPLSKSEKERV